MSTTIGLAEEQNWSVLLDEAEGGEVVEELAVHARLELEIEVGERAPEGEPGVAQPGGEPTVAVGGGLFGDEPGKELDMRRVIRPRLLARTAKD